MRFKIITPTGFLAFTVRGEWPVNALYSRLPAVAVFQIPNPADEDTPDSTNAAISILDVGTEEGRRAARVIGRRCSDVEPRLGRIQDWEAFAQDGCRQSSTPIRYSVRDAKRTVNGLTVAVRLAWPHLPGNSKGYDGEMERLFKDLLASVYGREGPYELEPGEVFRRPQ